MPNATPVDLPSSTQDGSNIPEWGSDLAVQILRLLEIEYVAVLPGATTRGLHDSIVNHAGNSRPELILCNHEMITVALARGYARVRGRPMGALVHNVVGLLNASMTVFDAWYDRVPVLIIGGAGPLDSQHRRPWIDWLHTANNQGDIVRNFTKWDDQPISPGATVESLLRAYRIACTEPQGPVYISIDVDVQEQRLTLVPGIPDVGRYRPASSPAPDESSLRQAASLLLGAEFPVAFADRVGRDSEAVEALVDLAELLAMPVVDMGGRMNFPTPHDLEFSGMSRSLLKRADLVLGLDALDLHGAMRSPADVVTRESRSITDPNQVVVTISLDELLHRGWSTEYQGLPPVDLPMLADTRLAIPALADFCRQMMAETDRRRIDHRARELKNQQAAMRLKQRRYLEYQWNGSQISEARLLSEVWDAVKAEDYTFTSGPLRRMAPGVVHLKEPGQYVAGTAGAVVGAAPGVALGAALALKGAGKLPIAFLGDGSLLMSIQALWTAAHYEIASLWIVVNNRSYYNDQHHQEALALARSRPPENSWIAQRMEAPEPDFAAIARSFDLLAYGPIRDVVDLQKVLPDAVRHVKEGKFVLIDVWTANRDQR